MILNLTVNSAKQVINLLARHRGWVSYKGHDFQCESFEQLEGIKTSMLADYRFNLSRCISCHEKGKECKADEIFFEFVQGLEKAGT
ncbi:hypothetical protein AYI24_RS07115 [Acinetobacter baumannii]|uniref:hypothetical protein n=1 Tax=Acinetobacter baumannii TaxID=470 RepID=UPI000DD01CB4|nr:hypothetical protein [Acinetobacter baumannii]EHU2869900.1 hypothetical protein [Acinetobacter baumannii]EHU3047211.1 hypothetical protein [Acinetobacter baumannii]TPS59028.1 hypothetical protein FJV02_06350 [Acinetobacter baumannii]